MTCIDNWATSIHTGFTAPVKKDIDWGSCCLGTSGDPQGGKEPSGPWASCARVAMKSTTRVAVQELVPVRTPAFGRAALYLGNLRMVKMVKMVKGPGDPIPYAFLVSISCSLLLKMTTVKSQEQPFVGKAIWFVKVNYFWSHSNPIPFVKVGDLPFHSSQVLLRHLLTSSLLPTMVTLNTAVLTCAQVARWQTALEITGGLMLLEMNRFNSFQVLPREPHYGGI